MSTLNAPSVGKRTSPGAATGLGWLILGEQVSLRTGAGVAVILVGVALIVWSNRQTRPVVEKATEVAVELEALAA